MVVVGSQWFLVVFVVFQRFSVVHTGSRRFSVFSMVLSGSRRLSMFLSASC